MSFLCLSSNGTEEVSILSYGTEKGFLLSGTATASVPFLASSFNSLKYMFISVDLTYCREGETRREDAFHLLFISVIGGA